MNWVLDTNIIISLWHYREPQNKPLLDALETKQHFCFTDAFCLAELQRVLTYPQFKLSSANQAALCAQYQAIAILAPTTTISATLPRCRDPDDQKFLELASRCHADWLITRDKDLLRLAQHRHRPLPYQVMTPETALSTSFLSVS